jgi:hypothetical protein
MLTGGTVELNAAGGYLLDRCDGLATCRTDQACGMGGLLGFHCELGILQACFFILRGISRRPNTGQVENSQRRADL